VLNRVESTEYSRAMTVVYTHEYPSTLPMDGTGQLTMLNARCLPIYQTILIFYKIYNSRLKYDYDMIKYRH